MSALVAIYFLAAVVFVFGVADMPYFGTNRCIALGLALIAAAMAVAAIK